MSENLRITEIFYSLQGESRTVGLPTVFIRLTGCPLRCGYCDTEYAFKGGARESIDDILLRTAAYSPRYITVTGGEPLAQKNCHRLLTRLCDAGYEVSLETSGALSIAEVDPRVVIVMDLKTPGSGEVDKNDWTNLNFIKKTDQIKFVICDEADYQWSVACLREHHLADRAECLFSPSYEELAPRDLAEWILRDRLPVRMQIQLHKVIWGEEKGR